MLRLKQVILDICLYTRYVCFVLISSFLLRLLPAVSCRVESVVFALTSRCLHRMLSPPRVFSRPPSSHSTPCTSPGRPWPTTPVSHWTAAEWNRTQYALTVAWICFLTTDRQCNPSLLSLVQPSSSTTPAPTPLPSNVQWWDAQSIVGLLIFLFCTLYARYLPRLLLQQQIETQNRKRY